MCNVGHFLVLRELAEKEKVYKDRFNINRLTATSKIYGDVISSYEITVEFPSLKILFL